MLCTLGSIKHDFWFHCSFLFSWDIWHFECVLIHWKILFSKFHAMPKVFIQNCANNSQGDARHSCKKCMVTHNRLWECKTLFTGTCYVTSSFITKYQHFRCQSRKLMHRTCTLLWTPNPLNCTEHDITFFLLLHNIFTIATLTVPCLCQQNTIPCAKQELQPTENHVKLILFQEILPSTVKDGQPCN